MCMCFQFIGQLQLYRFHQAMSRYEMPLWTCERRQQKSAGPVRQKFSSLLVHKDSKSSCSGLSLALSSSELLWAALLAILY